MSIIPTSSDESAGISTIYFPGHRVTSELATQNSSQHKTAISSDAAETEIKSVKVPVDYRMQLQTTVLCSDFISEKHFHCEEPLASSE